jgi:hypothetical protein
VLEAVNSLLVSTPSTLTTSKFLATIEQVKENWSECLRSFEHKNAYYKRLYSHRVEEYKQYDVLLNPERAKEEWVKELCQFLSEEGTYIAEGRIESIGLSDTYTEKKRYWEYYFPEELRQDPEALAEWGIGYYQAGIHALDNFIAPLKDQV